jgi:hypothetical protein
VLWTCTESEVTQVFPNEPVTMEAKPGPVKVTVRNGTPGLTNLSITINRETFSLIDLEDKAVKTVDVSAASVAGNNNTITLEAQGKPGGSSRVEISY